MVTRYSAWLNGIGLQDFDERVVITDIVESVPALEMNAIRNGAHDGQRVLRQYRASLEVTIRFSVEEYDTARRKDICSRIAVWAMGGGWLTISDRPDQRLRVVCTRPPVVASAQKWLDGFEAVFTAYAVPYWQDNTRQFLGLLCKSGVKLTDGIRPRGDAGKAYVEVDAQVTAGTMTAIDIRVGDTRFVLKGLSVTTGQTLRIFYDDLWNLCIEADGVSVYGSRTASSSDDLLAVTGKGNTVEVLTTGADVNVRIKPRGLYL